MAVSFRWIPKPRLEREGLIGEIGLVLLGICAALIGLMAVFTLGAQKQNEGRSIHAYGRQICSVLATTAAAPLAERDSETLETLVRSLASRQGLVYASVGDLSGKFVVETDQADLGEEIPVLTGQYVVGRGRARVIRGDGREMFSVSAPVTLGDRQVGVAQVVVARTSTSLEPAEFGRFVGIVALVAFLLVGATYGYLRLVLRPLPKLIKELSEQIHQKTIREIHFKGRGQLRDLINAWNDAVRVFHEQIDEIDRAKNQIEIEKHVLEYEKRRVESIVNFLPIGVLVTNASGKVVMTNRAAQNLLSKGDADLMGQSLGNALGQPQFDEVLNESRATRSVEMALGGSSERIVKLTISDLSAPGHRPVGLLMTIREITQQKLADRTTSEFVNHVAHEFRTPLASIRAYAEMLVDDQVDDDTTRFEFYNTIAQETERLTKLIENLLNISKMEVGSLTANRVPVRIDKVITETAKSLEPQATTKGITFNVEVPDPTPPMELDKELVSVALFNLVGNALKYTPPGGTVEVVAKTEEKNLTIRVRDTGPGILEEDVLHIFEKFYRSGEEDIQKQPGSGLGLSLAQQIAFVHGGEITVTSEPGQGSEFCLALPVAQGKQVPEVMAAG